MTQRPPVTVTLARNRPEGHRRPRHPRRHCRGGAEGDRPHPWRARCRWVRGQAGSDAGDPDGHRADDHRRRHRRRRQTDTEGVARCCRSGRPWRRDAGEPGDLVGRHRGRGWLRCRSGRRRRRAAGDVPVPRAQDRGAQGGHRQPDARRRPEAHRRRQGRRPPRRGDRRSHGAGARSGQHPTWRSHRAGDGRPRRRGGRGQRAHRRGVQPRPAQGDGLRRDGRGQRRQRRAAAHGPPDVHPGRPDGTPGARRQGRHVRLGGDQPQAERRVARDDEDGHERGRRGAGDDERAVRPRLPARPSPVT